LGAGLGRAVRVGILASLGIAMPENRGKRLPKEFFAHICFSRDASFGKLTFGAIISKIDLEFGNWLVQWELSS
jgi:hypothetical protein